MIESRSIFNAQLIMPFARFVIRKPIKFLAVMGFVLIFLGALLIVTDETVFGIAIIAFGVMLLIFLPLLITLSVNASIKLNRMASEETVQLVRLDAYYMYTSTSKGSEFVDSATFAINSLFSAHQTATHFYLCIAKNQAIIIPKSDIIMGTARDLSSLLRQTLGTKYMQDKNAQD